MSSSILLALDERGAKTLNHPHSHVRLAIYWCLQKTHMYGEPRCSWHSFTGCVISSEKGFSPEHKHCHTFGTLLSSQTYRELKMNTALLPNDLQWGYTSCDGGVLYIIYAVSCPSYMESPGLLLILNILHLRTHNTVFISFHEQSGQDLILILIRNFPIAWGAKVLQQKWNVLPHHRTIW